MTTANRMTPWMMNTSSWATPAWICRALACTSRKAHSSEAKTMPTALLRPSRAMAMPAKPRPDWKVVP
jgi:hypothetical protein